MGMDNILDGVKQRVVKYPPFNLRIVDMHCSDHHPLLISQELSDMQHLTPFRFFKSRTSHDDCERVVKEEWNKQVVGDPMACVQTKLKRLKVALQAWNKEVFENIDALQA
ncbi:hypothetical protein TSUD_244810 [Trifolium subterraneum]|uniref:Endonuclease/exonuclease/phosphatase domain-containing protein n=1 Tax=Trifolium subterraneum TaxID=3900 RepID=A0A2Z6NCI7_TRISU|nr:hypothetical protein TSUD_244810 [Trifolium subterraneum]